MLKGDDSSLPLYPIEQWQNTSQSSPASLVPPNPSTPSSCHIDESYKYIFLPLCYSVTFLLSLVLNSIILHRSFCGAGHRGGGRAKRWTPSLTYMVNLAATDLMYGLSLPFLIANYAMRDRWIFGDPVCRLVRFLFYFNLYCSLAFLACISLHRYLGVCHPLRSLASRGPQRAVKGVCLLVWSVVFALTSPIFRFARTGKSWDGNTVCWDDAPDWELQEYVPYGITLHVLLFCLPFGVIGWCYSRVARTIFRSLGEEGGGGDGGLHSSSSPPPPPSHSFLSLRQRRKSIRRVVTITLLLALCFLPFHVTRTVFLLLKGSAWGADCHTVTLVSICYKLTRPLASFNAWLNALLYFLTKGRGVGARGEGGVRGEGGARRLEVLQQQQDLERKSTPPSDSGFKISH
ncbi:P2Y purinoceptor 3-like [Polyodon spathula]|uniref:P2Y purinoceptor 3-like n=1 Tax=Polyodon spathula TaxID=7913 RepID=UPI001B7D9923|nr:P2Y purinoceptor 3-like [Polyodon spathula]